MPRHYPPEFRQRAVRMVEEALPDYATEFEAIKKVASRLGVSPEAVRRWRGQQQVDAGLRPGLSSDEHTEIAHRKRVSAELRRANRILKTGGRPHQIWVTREDLRIAIVTMIKRTHHVRNQPPRTERLGRLTPIKFEAIMTAQATQAA